MIKYLYSDEPSEDPWSFGVGNEIVLFFLVPVLFCNSHMIEVPAPTTQKASFCSRPAPPLVRPKREYSTKTPFAVDVTGDSLSSTAALSYHKFGPSMFPIFFRSCSSRRYCYCRLMELFILCLVSRPFSFLDLHWMNYFQPRKPPQRESVQVPRYLVQLVLLLNDLIFCCLSSFPVIISYSLFLELMETLLYWVSTSSIFLFSSLWYLVDCGYVDLGDSAICNLNRDDIKQLAESLHQSRTKWRSYRDRYVDLQPGHLPEPEIVSDVKVENSPSKRTAREGSSTRKYYERLRNDRDTREKNEVCASTWDELSWYDHTYIQDETIGNTMAFLFVHLFASPSSPHLCSVRYFFEYCTDVLLFFSMFVQTPKDPAPRPTVQGMIRNTFLISFSRIQNRTFLSTWIFCCTCVPPQIYPILHANFFPRLLFSSAISCRVIFPYFRSRAHEETQAKTIQASLWLYSFWHPSSIRPFCDWAKESIQYPKFSQQWDPILSEGIVFGIIFCVCVSFFVFLSFVSSCSSLSLSLRTEPKRDVKKIIAFI